MIEINVQKKEEAYSFDELCFIEKSIENTASDKSDLVKKIHMLSSAIKEDAESKAVFFMPKTTFDIFSMIQGNNSITEINAEEIKICLESVSGYCNQEKSADYSEVLKNHIVKKLRVLNDFLQTGNLVKPVTIQVSEFCKM